MNKLRRVVKIAEFFIPFFSTFTADFDSSRLQCLIPLPLDELSCVPSSNSAMVMLEKSSCKIYSLKMTVKYFYIFIHPIVCKYPLISLKIKFISLSDLFFLFTWILSPIKCS